MICNDCGKKGYFLSHCICTKKEKKDENTNDVDNANMVDGEVKEIVAMVFELQIGRVNELSIVVVIDSLGWYWFASTIHLCNENLLFKNYEGVEETNEMMIGYVNSAKSGGIRQWNSSSILEENWFLQMFIILLKLEKSCIYKFVV